MKTLILISSLLFTFSSYGFNSLLQIDKSDLTILCEESSSKCSEENPSCEQCEKLFCNQSYFERAVKTNRVLKVISILMFCKMNTNAKDVNNTTLLMFSAAFNHEKMAHILIKHGASVNLQNNWGSTALMLAAKSGSRNAIETLLYHNASVNIKNNLDQTALDFALNYNYTEIEDLLRKAGAE